MTSGSTWTHLIVTSRALVDEREEGIPLAGIAAEAAMPFEHCDRLIERLVDGGHRAGLDDGRRSASQPVAQRHEIVHRNLPLAVADSDQVGEHGHGMRVVARDRWREPVDERLEVAEERLALKLGVAIGEGRVQVERGRECASAEARAATP